MKLKSFGCSLIYGSDLHDSDNCHSVSTWPALISQTLNLDYECHALPGQGNFKIMCDISRETSDPDISLFLINWTWNDRFDYIDSQELWNTLRPSEDTEIEKFYYRNIHSQFKDMLASSSYITSTISLLESKNIPFLMTYMDYTLFEPINPNWHDPRYLETSRSQMQPHLKTFDGANFLDWAKKHEFAISDRWHPLEEAHQVAAMYWQPDVERLLNFY